MSESFIRGDVDDPDRQDGGLPARARVLVACTLGLGLGSSALLFYTMGIFAVPLERAIGLTRTQFGVGTLLATLVVSLSAPLVGALVDRCGVRRVVLPSAVLLGAGFVAITWGTVSVVGFLVTQTIVAALASGTSPVSFTRAIAATFDRRRGLALGVALTGMGLSAALTPVLIAQAISRSGWQGGYLFLACLAFAGILPAIMLPGRESPRATAARHATATGIPFAEALRSPAFAILTLAFVVQSLAFGGFLPHLVPLLIDADVAPVQAAAYAGLIGLAVMGSRLLAGWLTDLIFAPWIACAACLLCAAGCSLLLWDAVTLAPFAALALGCAIGAEVDLIGYCASRYFGMRAYGRIYGVMYGGFLTGSGFGPVWVGAIRDGTGSYTLAIAIGVAGLFVAGLLFLRAPPYPTGAFVPDADLSAKAPS